MSKIFIGIDPGKKGAIAAIKENGEATCVEMPLLDNDEIDASSVATIISLCQQSSEVFCMIEKAQAMPGQGVTSMFSYGSGYGELKAVLKILKVPFEEIQSMKWKKEFSLVEKSKIKKGEDKRSEIEKRKDKKDKKKKGKDSSISLAQKMFPKIKFKTERGRKLDGIAEALLIAEYGRRKYSK